MKSFNFPSFSIKSAIILFLVLILSACSTSNRGGYYKNDGPGRRNVDVNSIPNAVPKDEPFINATLKPYTINGKRFVPLKSAQGYVKEGRASWYGRRYHGRKTSTGEVYDMFKMTAAHPTLPLPSYVRVTNVDNQRSVIVRLNDRGPFIGNRIIDLSYVAAKKLGVVSAGTGNVRVESVTANSLQQQSVKLAGTSPSLSTALPVGPIPAEQKPVAEPRYSLPSSQKSAASAIEQNPSTSVGSQAGSQASLPQLVPVNPSSQARTNQNTRPASAIVTYAKNQWIQVGAFSVVTNAQKLQSRLNRSGYSNTQIIRQSALFKVMVGPLTQEQFISTQRSLKTNGYSALKAKQ